MAGARLRAGQQMLPIEEDGTTGRGSAAGWWRDCLADVWEGTRSERSTPRSASTRSATTRRVDRQNVSGPRSAMSSWPPRVTANGAFEPRVGLPKGQRRVGGLSDMIISRYAAG